MTSRWWDPSAPVVALLEPGDDPKLDLANALVATHRAGAAALQVAGATPLVDEQTVVDALVDAREAFAPPVVASISKSLGDTRYAGLLVRDVADSAEQAALGVFKVCVAKGVAPPLAAERASHIYGVPTEMLGRYLTLAADTKTPPVALVDAADRALFGWVAKVSEEQASEAIAKAESRETRRAAQAEETREHGRYAKVPGGQTVVEWLSQFTGSTPQTQTGDSDPLSPAGGPTTVADDATAQPTTVGPVTVAGAPTAPKTILRTRRGVRRGVKRRTTGEATETLTATRGQGKTFAARRLTAKALTVQQLTAKTKQKVIEVPTRKHRVPRDPGDITTVTGPVTAPSVNDDVAYVLVYDEWLDFRRAAKTGPRLGDAVFTARGLANYVGGGGANPADSKALQEEKAGLADLVRAGAAGPDQSPAAQPREVVWRMDPKDQLELEQAYELGERTDLLNKMKARYLRKHLEQHGVDPRVFPISDEISHIHDLADYDDPEQLLLVWSPPTPERVRTHVRPRVVLAEVVIESKNLHGHTTSDESHHHDATVSIDPNQVLLSSGQSANGIAPDQYYDQKLGARIVRYVVRAVDQDNLSKAESSETRRAAQADEPRAHGRYAQHTIDGKPVAQWLQEHIDAAEQTRAAAPVRAGVLRTRRGIRRTQRRSAAEPPAAKQLAAKQLAAKQQHARRWAGKALQVKRATPSDPDEPSLPLHDRSTYTVLGAADMLLRLGVPPETGRPVDVEGKGARWLLGMPRLNDEEVVHEVALQTNDAELLGQEQAAEFVVLNDGNGKSHAAARVWEIANRYAVTAVTFRAVGRNSVRVTVFDLTDRAQPPVSALRWNVGTDPDTRLKLEWSGSYRLLNREEFETMVKMGWEEAHHGSLDPVTVFNPKVDTWTIQDRDGDEP